MKPISETPLAIWALRACVHSRPVMTMLEFAETARSRNCDCHFLLGSQLTVTKHAYLIYLRGCEFFSFCLTEEQAKVEGAEGGGLGALIDGPRLIPPAGTPFHLQRVEIERDQELNLGGTISGRLHARSDATFVSGVCLRFQTVLRLRNSTGNESNSRFFYPEVQQGETLPFKLDAVRGAAKYASPQVAAVFAQYVSESHPVTKLCTPLSNVVGTIATFI